MYDFHGKVAVVTGSSTGIGRAIALRLAKEGADVVVNCARSVSDGEKVVQEITRLGRRSLLVQADVGKSGDVEKLFKTALEKFGKVDILVNNAGGGGGGGPVVNLKEEDWDRTFAVNMKGTYLCSKEAAKDMIKRKSGKIINISSAVGKVGTPEGSAYSSAKSAVNTFTHALAKELAKYNINVNCICPGAILTERRSVSSADKARPVGGWPPYTYGPPTLPPFGWGTPEDIASAVAFFASDESKYISGQVINVDGAIW